MSARRVNVRINRLVIDRRLAVDGQRFARDLKAGIEREIAAQELPEQGGTTQVQNLKTDPLPRSAQASADSVARRVARSIRTSMGQRS
jgi:hypothetical protein